MGLFRYIVQGFGWHVGSHVAGEAIDALHKPGEDAPRLTPRQARKLERDQRKEAEREAARRREQKRLADAAIEAQLRELKKKADR